MFCPNCGTQNPDAAQTCSKCGFHLKGVAAPKFKGTMLMMNQTGSTPPPPAGLGARPPSGPPQAPAPGMPPSGMPASGMPNKLKGTMVGVAPMAGPVRGPSPVAVPPAAQGFGAPPGAPGMGAPGGFPAPPGPDANSSFSPPVPQGGVNPLGGTLAVEGSGFGSPYGQPGAPYGQAPGGAPYGGPPAGQRQIPGTLLMPGGGAMPPSPQPQYGAPPGGGMPSYDPPAPGGYPGAGYGGPGGAGQATAMAPAYDPPAQAFGGAAAAGPLAQVGQGASALAGRPAAGAGPTRRNALMTWLLPLLVMFGGIVLSVVLAFIVPALSVIGSLAVLGGSVWYLILAIVMSNEVKAVTRNEGFAWWPIFVPIYSMYWMWILVPQEVAKAKQLRGVQQPTQSIILYIFLWHFALASDLNDIAR